MRILLATLVIAAIPPAKLLAQISVNVSTDQPSYVTGEPIAFTVTAVNSSREPITLHFPSSLQSQYVVDNAFFAPIGGFQVFTQVTVPGKGTFDWNYYHDWNSYPLGIGSHQVIGSVADVLSYRISAPSIFEIVEPKPVVDDVFIDFESFPDETPVRLPNGQLTSRFSSESYAAWGINFRSDFGRLVTFNFQELGSNNVLSNLYGSGPWNIVAEFDMPVFAISADVGADNGHSVSLSAFDAAGNLLGTALSDPTTDFPHLVGPLEFKSEVPIAAVEWKTTEPFSPVRIDNLHLDVVAVPEPSTTVLMIVAVVGLLSVRRLSPRTRERMKLIK